MAKSVDVTVPDIGDYKEVPVIEILVKEGDRVEKDAALITLESEKATMEVPSPTAGVVRGIKVKVGDKVSQNDVIMALEAEGPAGSKPEPIKPPPTPSPQPSPKGRGSESPLPPGEVARSAGEGGSKLEVTVPDIGDYHDVPVIEVLIKDGDTVEKDAPLIVLESEKATMEVPAPAAGMVRGLRVRPGSKVSKGTAICALETSGIPPVSEKSPLPLGEVASLDGARDKLRAGEGGRPALTPALSQREREKSAPPAPPAGVPPWVSQAQGAVAHASPAVRKLAREFGVDLAKIQGSGPKGRIVQEDVQAYTKKALTGAAPAAGGGAGIPPIPAVDFSQWGEIETKALARIRKLSAQYLHRAWLNIPHVTQNDEADITELEAFRKSQSEESGVKLTLLPFVMKAVSVALKSFPEFNASLAPDGESLILKKYCNLGFAADTEHGLVVPVVKDVWSKGIAQLASDCAELAKKAREGKLKPDEMKGGCFSISSLGGIGGSHFTPIVNAPEVAILGVSRAQTKPVWNGREFAPRLMCPLSLSYDHRVIDGAYAARFIVHLGKLVSDMRRLAL